MISGKMTKIESRGKNDDVRIMKDEGRPNEQTTKRRSETSRHSGFVIPSSSDIRHSSLPRDLIASATQLAELLPQIESVDRVAIDTEADSLHCYREKLCLVQISLPVPDVVVPRLWDDAGQKRRVVAGIGDAGWEPRDPKAGRDHRSRLQWDYIVDPLVAVDLSPLRAVLERKKIVLHGADFDLRLLRRGLNLVAHRIFDTVIAARLLGIREFSLAALVKRYFGVELGKGSQKANWAQRPLSARMIEYAINDTHYLLPLAERLGSQLRECDRLDWLRQSCQRAIEQAALERVRNEDELWRIPGSASLRGCEAAVLRALWQWREKEAETADRPPFHILQNHELLGAALIFASGKLPDYRHFSSRRRQAFRMAAQDAMQLPESEWPVSQRRFGTRPSPEAIRRAEELRRRRDRAARELDLEQSFIAPRSTIEAIAAKETRAASLLVPWQRELLGIKA
jgi:ribonuclease D